MSRSLGELRRGDEISKVQQQRLDVCTVFTPTSRATLSIVKIPNESTTYDKNSSRCSLTSVDWDVPSRNGIRPMEDDRQPAAVVKRQSCEVNEGGAAKGERHASFLLNEG
jgi:hypothetical protein